MTLTQLVGAIGRIIRWALLAVLIAAVGVPVWHGMTDSGGLVSGGGNHAYVRGTTQQRVQVAEVLDRYGAAGFRLPFVVVSYRPWDWCPGRVRGRAEPWSHGGHIDVCEHRHRAVAHELAHLYVYAATTEDQREAFRTRRGLPTWNGARWPWTERATEHAANLIVWWAWDRDHGDYVYERTRGARPAQDLADLAWLLSVVEPRSFEAGDDIIEALTDPTTAMLTSIAPPPDLVRVAGAW